MAGLKATNMAGAMYPHLKDGGEPKQSDRGQVGKPAWGRSTHPAWLGPQPPIPPDYSKVPGLVRKVNR
jgi:hypothetical protein